MSIMEQGAYTARATGGAYGRSSKGNEQVAVSFVITASPQGKYDGAHLTWYGYFTDKTSDRTMESLLACGVTNLATLEGVSANEVQITVGHEENQHGELQARVQWVNRLGGIAMKDRMSEGEARSFASRMQGAFLKAASRLGVSVSSPNARPVPPPPPPARQPPASRPVSKGSPHDPPASTQAALDDDIPF